MKKFFVLVLVVAALVGIYYANKEKENAPEKVVTTEGSPDPSSATFIFDDGKITLSNGRSEKEDSETGISEEVYLLEEKASGDLNADGKADTVVLIARSGGGSGVFIYAAAYVSGPINYKGTNAAYLGDRISPQSISIKNGVATVNYLDRKEDEPFAAEPSVPASKQFVYKNGEFVER